MTPPSPARHVLALVARLDVNRNEIVDHLESQYETKVANAFWTRRRADRWYSISVYRSIPRLLWAFADAYLAFLNAYRWLLGLAAAALVSLSCLDRIPYPAIAVLGYIVITISLCIVVVIACIIHTVGVKTGSTTARHLRSTVIGALIAYAIFEIQSNNGHPHFPVLIVVVLAALIGAPSGMFIGEAALTDRDDIRMMFVASKRAQR